MRLYFFCFVSALLVGCQSGEPVHNDTAVSSFMQYVNGEKPWSDKVVVKSTEELRKPELCRESMMVSLRDPTTIWMLRPNCNALCGDADADIWNTVEFVLRAATGYAELELRPDYWYTVTRINPCTHADFETARFTTKPFKVYSTSLLRSWYATNEGQTIEQAAKSFDLPHQFVSGDVWLYANPADFSKFPRRNFIIRFIKRSSQPGKRSPGEDLYCWDVNPRREVVGIETDSPEFAALLKQASRSVNYLSDNLVEASK